MNTSILYDQDPYLDSIFAKKKKTDVIVKTEPVIKSKTDTDNNIKKTDDIPIKNPINKTGRLVISRRAQNDQIDLNLFQDLKKAVKAANIGNVEITFARTGHDKYTESGSVSRHYTGDAVDISRLNGITYQDDKKTFTVLGNLLIAELKKLGYVLWESGNKKSYIWQVKDHYDHIHVSVLPVKQKKTFKLNLEDQLKIHKDISKIYHELYIVLTKNPEKGFSSFKSVYDPSYWGSKKRGQLIVSDDERGAANWFKYIQFQDQYGKKLESWEKNKNTHPNDIANIKQIRKVVDFFYNKILNGDSGTYNAKYYFYDTKNGWWYKSGIKYTWNYM